MDVVKKIGSRKERTNENTSFFASPDFEKSLKL